MKKALIICGVLLILLIGICFWIGYKLPQRDIHKDWTLLEENKDPNYAIKRTIGLNTAIKLGSSKLLMMINYNQMFVVDSNGTVLHKFITSSDVYIDILHNRIVTIKPAADYQTSKIIKYVSFYLKDFSEQPVDLIEYPLSENFYDFVQRKGQNLNTHNNNTVQDHVRDSLLARQYKAAHIQDVAFFATLHPVLQLVDAGGGTFGVKYYTDAKGKLYDIRPLKDTTSTSISTSYDDFIKSMDILYPAWAAIPDIELQQGHSPNFHIADNSAIADNDFKFELGINFNPAGGSNKHMRMYFEQNYLHYYAVKLKDSTAHFKIYDNVHIFYVKDMVRSFLQLNNPKSERDTLAFIYDSRLYKLYRRNKL